MKQRKVRLKDIAEKAGVSTALVSYVLNNKMTKRINKDSAKKIRQVAKELNYQPNQIAKSLKSQKTYTIGLIIANIANPFFAQITRIIGDEARKKNYTLIIGNSDDDFNKSDELIQTFLNRQVDGIIITAVEKSENQIREIESKGIPVILIDRFFPNEQFNYITTDNYQATFDATQHLLDNGYKRIGFINHQTNLCHMQERARGYVEALQKNGNENILKREVSHEREGAEIAHCVEALLKMEEPVDAIFFSTILLTINGLKHLMNKKISIPKDLAVVAFDKTNIYDLFAIPLTYVKQPLEKISKAAVKSLLELMDDKSKTIQKKYKGQLIVRESSGKGVL